MLGTSALTKLQREIGGGAIGSRPVLAKLMREIAVYGHTAMAIWRPESPGSPPAISIQDGVPRLPGTRNGNDGGRYRGEQDIMLTGSKLVEESPPS